ncbi:MAG TPA: hypothetical protein DDX92_00470 [Flavobacteriales bacterium]|jgi:uncharacterized membrane protein|nr:hypothetical protein [Flavobacteriales bacterium]
MPDSKEIEMSALTPAEANRQKNVLRRLQTLVDVVYGLMIFRLFILLPHPTAEQLANKDFFGMYAENGVNLLIVLIGIVLIIIYWGQSNLQLGYLKRIDTRVATLAILQVFALLIYLYFMRLDNESDGDEFTLLMESVFMAIAGFIGIYNWSYCGKKKFFQDDLTEKEAVSTSYKFYAEPIVATLTIPLAFVGSGYYMAGWLLIIPITILLNKRKKSKIERVVA